MVFCLLYWYDEFMFKKKVFIIFVFSFIIACFFQYVRWATFDFVDASMWANQARYFETGNNEQFNMLAGYGHPGGPIIEGVISFKHLLGISYEYSLVLFMVLFNSLIIASICVLCFLLKKNNYWWMIALSTLSLNRLYDFSTPPAALIGPLIVFLCLLTLYIYENKDNIKTPAIIFWSFIAGLAVSVRVDMGVFFTLIFLIFLKQILSWKKIFIIIVGAFVSFFIFDPFMYFMPLKHIKDLIYKITFHYAEFAPTHLSFLNVLNISSLLIISIFLALVLIFISKRKELIIPFKFILMLLFSTIVLYFIFLTSDYQALRYFQSIIFVWEVFLPIFIFSLTKRISFSFLETEIQKIKAQKIMDIFFVIVLVGYQLFLFSLWFFYGSVAYLV